MAAIDSGQRSVTPVDCRLKGEVPTTLSPQKNAQMPAGCCTHDQARQPAPLTREEYHKMIAAGVFKHPRRAAGWRYGTWTHPTRNRRIYKTTAALRDHLPGMTPWWIAAPYRRHKMVTGAGCHSRAWHGYDDHHPSPEEVLAAGGRFPHPRRDRGKKAKSYARAGITDYWIVNWESSSLVQRQPTPDCSPPSADIRKACIR